MLQSQIFEGLAVDAIDDTAVKRNIINDIVHTIEGERQNCSDAAIDEFDAFDAAAQCVRHDLIRVHLNKDKAIHNIRQWWRREYSLIYTHSIEFNIDLWRWHSHRELQSERFHCQIVNVFQCHTIQLTAPTECALSYMQTLTIGDRYVIDVSRQFWQNKNLLQRHRHPNIEMRGEKTK